MPTAIHGLHHVTAVAGDAQANLDFYTDVLGLRFVKRTVNFDDPSTYHLYYGDAVGTPGTVLTFFPFAGAAPGRIGHGQASATAFVVPPDTVDYWWDRLEAAGVEVKPPELRFDDAVLRFRDPEGQPLELVTGESPVEPWAEGPVPADRAVRGFHGVTLRPTDADATAGVLETMGYERAAREGDRIRFVASGAGRASIVDLLDRPTAPAGRPGSGTVHHVAFRVADDDAQAAWREALTDAGLRVTPVRDRQYFRSIYFREPGGVLFELATEGPGFTTDEGRSALGSTLKLPPWLEDRRDAIERGLPPLAAAPGAEADD